MKLIFLFLVSWMFINICDAQYRNSFQLDVLNLQDPYPTVLATWKHNNDSLKSGFAVEIGPTISINESNDYNVDWFQGFKSTVQIHKYLLSESTSHRIFLTQSTFLRIYGAVEAGFQYAKIRAQYIAAKGCNGSDCEFYRFGYGIFALKRPSLVAKIGYELDISPKITTEFSMSLGARYNGINHPTVERIFEPAINIPTKPNEVVLFSSFRLKLGYNID